jgi:hypothetical protein
MFELLCTITEDDMIAEFLRAEVRSSRFGHLIQQILERDGVSESVLSRPNTQDAAANVVRHRILEEYRGYDRRIGVFNSLPVDIQWHRALATIEELRRVRYIDYPYWVELSGGTRFAEDAVRRIGAGQVKADVFAPITSRDGGAAALPELILVAGADTMGPVILEGHVRLTSYLLDPNMVPDRLQVILGTSHRIRDWRLY